MMVQAHPFGLSPNYPYQLTLVNPSFELGNATGWNNTVGALPSVVAGGGFESSYRAIASANNSYNAWGQTVTLPTEVLYDVDAGLLRITAKAMQNSFASDADTGRVVLECFNASGEWLGDVNSGWLDTNVYVQRTASMPLPRGTRSVRIGTNNVRSEGTELSVYWDKFEIELTKVTKHKVVASLKGDSATGWVKTSGSGNVISQVQNLRFLGNVPALVTNGAGVSTAQKDINLDLNLLPFIDAGQATMDFFAWMCSPTTEGNDDTGLVRLYFLDATDTIIGTALESGTARVAITVNGLQTIRNGPVPVGCRKLRLYINFNEPDAGTQANCNLHRVNMILSAAGIP